MSSKGNPFYASMSLSFLALVSHLSVMANDAYVADRDAKVSVNCTCVLATSACQLKVLDALSGKERLEWSYTAFIKKGTKYNLDQFCYRKRDVGGAGDSLCCEIPNDESTSVKRLFKGEIK